MPGCETRGGSAGVSLALALVAGAGWLFGCPPSPAGGEPSAFFLEASLARWMDRDHPSLEPDGAFLVDRQDASSTWRGRTRRLARLSADLAVLPGREEALHRHLHQTLETALEGYGLVLTQRDDSVAGHRWTVAYRGAEVLGWATLAGVRTGERSYRVDLVIAESPVPPDRDDEVD